MGVFRKLFHREPGSKRVNRKQSKGRSLKDALDKHQGRSYHEDSCSTSEHVAITPRAPERVEQHGHLQRLWALSTLHMQGQCALPCDGSLASMYTESLLEDGEMFISEKHYVDGVQKIDPWIENLSSPFPNGLSDSLTAPSSFCSMFEMLSLGTFCGSSEKAKNWDDVPEDPTPFPDPSEIEPLPKGIPQEICVNHQDSSRRDGLPEELSIPRRRPEQRSSFMRALRNLASVGRGCPSPYAVQKVNLYIEQPSTFGHTNSIGNSTITWPNEYRGYPHH